MDKPLRKKIFWLVVGLSCGLLFMGALRLSSVHPNILTAYARYATTGYVLVTVFFTIFLVRLGLPLNRFGFGLRPDRHQLLLALAAIGILRLYAFAFSPLVEQLFGSQRNLERFADVQGSASSLIILLITNWTLAAFGEEFAYRIVLMRGISYIFHDTFKGQVAAVIIQAVLFGLIHAYQGPAGIVGSAFSALIFGAVTIKSRWSIWPAAIAHGTNNTFGIVALYLGFY